MDIPFTISALRKAGLTQTQIGDALGLKQPTISDLESGKSGIKRPSYVLIKGLESLAAAYGVTTDPPQSSTAH